LQAAQSLIEDEKDAGSKQYQDLISTVNVKAMRNGCFGCHRVHHQGREEARVQLRVFKDLICDLKYDL
jgi:hypothetical protein